jgi:hypothetical protein
VNALFWDENMVLRGRSARPIDVLCGFIGLSEEATRAELAPSGNARLG